MRRVEPRGGRGLERLAGAGDIGLMAERGGMAEQEPRIELRRVDAGLAQGWTPPRRRPGSRSAAQACASSCMAESWEV